MPRSSRSLILPGSEDVPWLITRACAGEWAYVPDWLTFLRHPSVGKRYTKVSRLFLVPDMTDRSIQVAVEIIRRSAREELADKEVKHFEVVPVREHDFQTRPHEACEERGCTVCGGFGALFVPQAGSHVDLMGWVAVVNVAR